MSQARLLNNRLCFEGELVIPNVSRLLDEATEILAQFHGSELVVDLSEVERIDSAGVALLDEVISLAKVRGVTCHVKYAQMSIQKAISTFSSKKLFNSVAQRKESAMERLGGFILQVGRDLIDFLYLIADTAYYAIAGLATRKGIRKGEFINQCILIGMNALPIVALIAFLIGLILALQSAAQLRQFGASIFVADLIAISMTREMGPIMTAIVVAGRSGSAVASEIATMVVTEETDALKSMALNPVRYVLVPKFYAITMTMPLLTLLSMVIGILGALVIGVTYLEIGIVPFFNEAANALVLKDIITGLVKSLVFAWLIVVTGAYYGFRVQGGSEGVGRATTASVVASIFLVILADCIFGLLFYFDQSVSF